MVQDPYGVLADDRINNNLDFNEINSKEDYKKKVKEYLETTRDNNGKLRGLNILNKGDYPLDDMYENSKAKERVEKNSKQKKIDDEDEYKRYLRKAQRLHSRRPRRGRLADERTTSKRTYRASRRSVRRWSRRMGKTDISGVDTRHRFRIAEKNKISRLDLRLKNIHVAVDKNGIKHYRGANGRFVPPPYRRTR